MAVSDKIRSALEDIGNARPEIVIEESGAGRITVVVISAAFEGMGEAERQELAWGKALGALSPPEVDQVEFIFTMTAGEYDSAA